MAFLEDFQTSLEALPALLQRHYSVIKELDKSLQDVIQIKENGDFCRIEKNLAASVKKSLVLQRQNELRCEQEIEEIKKGVQSGSIKSDGSHSRFSEEALDEQKHCIRISDEKITLSLTAYDVVDQQIQQLDEYLKKCEDVRREREVAATVGDPNGNNPKSAKAGESGRGVRKKTRTATAAAAAGDAAKTDTLVLELDIPVDPNEPTYCFCNQVSYGEMVACDNPDCKIEWFHYGCVGLKEQPKGKWYCSNCTGKKRRKGK